MKALIRIIFGWRVNKKGVGFWDQVRSLRENPLRIKKSPSPELVAAAISGIISLLIYLKTLSPDLTWANFSGDGPELVTASMTLGIAHPPGYPTYILLGRIFSLVPFGVPAARYNLFSAIAMTLATVFVTKIVVSMIAQIDGSDKTRCTITAVSAGLIFALTPTVWDQALIAEVYALNLLIVSVLIWLISTKEKRYPLVVGILLGLALTTHLTSLLLLPLVILLMPRIAWKRLITGIGLGLSPYLLLPLLSHSDGPAVWGNASSWQGWLSIVTAEIYQPNVFSAEPSLWIERLQHWPVQQLGMMAYISAPLLLIGFFFTNLARRSLYMVVIFLSIAGFYGLYAIGYRTNDASVLLLPGIMLLAVSLSPGLSRIGKVSLLIPLLMFVIYYGEANLSQESLVRETVLAYFQGAPPNALLFTPGDETIATLWYFIHVEGQRTDLIPVDDTLFQFEWYRRRLEVRYPDIGNLDEDHVQEFILANVSSRPVCFVSFATTVDNYCIDRNNLVQGQAFDEKSLH